MTSGGNTFDFAVGHFCGGLGLSVFLLVAVALSHLAADGACVDRADSTEFVRVEGGGLSAISTLGEIRVECFYMGRDQVTWGEWESVREWANQNGYDLVGVGRGSANNHPVHSVSWFDIVKWCNAKSERDGMQPAYWVDGAVYRMGETIPDWKSEAEGYRLPTEAEWEFSARGGTKSRQYRFSGSNRLADVGWFAGNSLGAEVDMRHGRGTWPVRQKAANELGLYDMSGNVWEWCWDASGAFRRFRGGSWINSESYCAVSYRGIAGNPDYRNFTHGFRIARSVF